MRKYKLGDSYISDDTIYCFIYILENGIYVGKDKYSRKRYAQSFSISYNIIKDIFKVETTSVMVNPYHVTKYFEEEIDIEEVKNKLRKIYLENSI